MGSSPVGSIPVGSIPVGSIPVGSIPVGSIPVDSIGLTATQSLLSSIALSTIPLSPPSSWAAVLAGTTLAGLPLQNVTLAQVLALAATTPAVATRLNSVPVGSINLSRSPLGSLTPAAIGLGSTPVGSIPVPPATGEPASDTTLQRWCTWLSGPPINCTVADEPDPDHDDGVGGAAGRTRRLDPGRLDSRRLDPGRLDSGRLDQARQHPGRLDHGAAGQHPVLARRLDPGRLDSRRLDSRRLDPDRLDPGRRRSTSTNSPVGSIPVNSIPVGSIHIVFICTTACPTTGTLLSNRGALQPNLTLEQLLRATPGAFANITFADVIGWTLPSVLNNYTVAQLINSLPPNSGITYADVLALLLNPSELSWETLDLTGTPIQNFSTGGSTLGYTADFHLAPNGGPVGVPHAATLDVKVPDGFVYQTGTTQLLVNAGSRRRINPATRRCSPTGRSAGT